MQRSLPLLIVTILLCGTLAIGAGMVANNISDSETDRINAQADLAEARGRAEAIITDAWGRATATIIAAQGQARLDSAIASQILMTAGLPYVALAIVALLGIGVVGLVLVILVKGKPKTIQQAIYLAHPAWYVIDEPNQIHVLEDQNLHKAEKRSRR